MPGKQVSSPGALAWKYSRLIPQSHESFDGPGYFGTSRASYSEQEMLDMGADNPHDPMNAVVQMKMRSRIVPVSVELLKSIFDWATVVLIALTVFSGAGAIITGDIISKRQENRLRQFEADLAGSKTELLKQQERAAKAEQDAAEAKTTASKTSDRATILETNAVEAKAAQQRVEIDLAKQQERAANAEKALTGTPGANQGQASLSSES